MNSQMKKYLHWTRSGRVPSTGASVGLGCTTLPARESGFQIGSSWILGIFMEVSLSRRD